MTGDGRKMLEFRRRMSKARGQKPNDRCQATEVRGQMSGFRSRRPECGRMNAEGGNIRFRISNFRFGNAEEIKPFPQSTNPPINNLTI